MYAACVFAALSQYVAQPVQDERQLDGSRHLELFCETDAETLSIRLVLNRDGELHEGELTIACRQSEAVAALDPSVANALDPLEIQIRARFDDRAGRIALSQREDGDFDISFDSFDSGGGE